MVTGWWIAVDVLEAQIALARGGRHTDAKWQVSIDDQAQRLRKLIHSQVQSLRPAHPRTWLF